MNSTLPQLKDALLDAGLTGPLEFWDYRSDSVWIVLNQAQLCGQCQGMHFVYVNREGRTRCWPCDDAYVHALSQPLCHSATVPPGVL